MWVISGAAILSPRANVWCGKTGCISGSESLWELFIGPQVASPLMVLSGAVSGVEEAADVLSLPKISCGTSRVGVGLSFEVARGTMLMKGLWKNWKATATRRMARDSSRRLEGTAGKNDKVALGGGVTAFILLTLFFEGELGEW